MADIVETNLRRLTEGEQLRNRVS
jgi:hypothetical protein